MRYAMRLEEFSDFRRGSMRAYCNQLTQPWVRRITGLNAGCFASDFVPGKREFIDANSSGTRGVFLYYALPEGLYQYQEQTRWLKAQIVFLQVSVTGEGSIITAERAAELLQHQSAVSGSAS